MSNSAPFNFSLSQRNEVDERTIRWLKADEFHANEVKEGKVDMDSWSVSRESSVDLLVACPGPRNEAGQLTGDTKQVRRRYFLEPGCITKIPSQYRNALQGIQNGVVTSGLLPHGRRLGAETVTVHPSLVDAIEPNRPTAPGTDDNPVHLTSDVSAEERAMQRAHARRSA